MARAWRIVITGQGPSRNDRKDDADAMARTLIDDLQILGHKITAATLQDDTGKNYPLFVTEEKAPAAESLKVRQDPILNIKTADPNVKIVAPEQPDASPAKPAAKRNPGDGQK